MAIADPVPAARWSLALALTLAAAFALRGLGVSSAYWFDEIWSTDTALAAGGVADIYRHALDNNHVLNTLLIHWIGPREGWIAYRLPALAGGLVALGLAVFAIGRPDPPTRLVRAALLGASPLLVLLSSEARGYGLALGLGAAAAYLLERWLARGGGAALLAFNLVLPLGLLAHLTFLHVYVAALAMAIHHGVSRGLSLPQQAERIAKLFALPALAAAAHGVFFVAGMRTGGGPAYTPVEFARRAVALTFGVPQWDALCLVVCVGAAVLFASHLRRLRQVGDSRWVYELAIVLLSPLFFSTFFAPGVIAVRYFAFQVFFLLLALADELAALASRGGGRRVAVTACLALVLLANASYHVDFARHGRGQYLTALEDMAAAQAGGGPISVAADHDARAVLLVNFYKRYIDRPIHFVRRDRIGESRPDWFIDHEVHEGGEPPGRIAIGGDSYRLHGRYDFAYLSGFRWNVYQRESADE